MHHTCLKAPQVDLSKYIENPTGTEPPRANSNQIVFLTHKSLRLQMFDSKALTSAFENGPGVGQGDGGFSLGIVYKPSIASAFENGPGVGQGDGSFSLGTVYRPSIASAFGNGLHAQPVGRRIVNM